MTPQELYDLPPEKIKEVSKKIYELLLYDHSHGHLNIFADHFSPSGFDFDLYTSQYDLYKSAPEDPHFEIRIIEHHHTDTRRYWRTATVWLNSKPVMVVQNAGRDGDDWIRHWVTDQPLYFELCQYVRSEVLRLIAPKIRDELRDPQLLIDPNTQIKELDEYYGRRFGDTCYGRHF
jgi:hypothetical protein